LLEQRGWRGILIEPQSALCAALREGRPKSTVVKAACGPPGHAGQVPFHIASVPSKSSLVKNLIEATTTYVQTELVNILTLDEILEQMGNPHIDFISIDVEGTQLDVLRGFDLQRFSPGLLLMEDHLHDLRVHRYLKSQGYRLVKRTGLNNWYIPRHRRFSLSSPIERVRLWKKVWGNTPFRKLRVFREKRRALRNRRAPDATVCREI
jgi:FkbM family methyltransferase